MNISKIKVGNTTYDLKDPNAISISTVSTWAQAGNSDTIPSSKLPSYVDDVLEYESTSSFPETGESGKIYVATDTNKTYRWGGSSYVVISETLAVGTTEGTAYDGAAGAALKSKLDGIEAGAQTHRAPSAAEVKTALGTGSGTTKYLREDGTWATPPDTDTNTVTSINGKTGAIAAADIATVLTGAGYKLTDTDTNTTYSAGTGLSLSGTTFALATSGVTAGTYKRVTVDAYGRVTSGDNTDADSWRTVQCNGTSIGNNTLNLKAGTNVSLSNSNGAITISSTDTNTWPTKTSQLTNDSGYITGITKTMVTNALGYTPPTTNSTYNFSGTSFTSNNSSGVNANDVTYNAHTYYTSNGPATSIGASTTDGALYSQAYSTSWVGQIAQDYRNGGLYVRGKNNGSWQSWYRVWDSRSLTNLNQLSNGPGYITGITKAMVTNALGYTPPTTNTTYSGSSTVTLSGTTFSLTKANVTTALGYTPPTSDTNTWRPLGTGASDACAGNDSRLSNSRPASDVYSWAKASSKPSYGYGEISYGVNTVTTSGAISLNGTTPVHVVTLNGNASSVALSANPAAGHSCHVIFFSTAARTVVIAHDATNRVCPKAANVTLNVPANGYVEVDFLNAGSKVWVRGV